MAGGVSKVLRELHYDRNRLILTVTFKSGAVYLFRDLPPAEFQALLAAESQGSYFARKIRNQYPCRKIQDTDQRRFAAAGISSDE